MDNRGGLSEQGYKDCNVVATKITDGDAKDETDWLLDETEKFCKDKAVYNAIIRSIEIIDGKSKSETKNAIPIRAASIMKSTMTLAFLDHIRLALLAAHLPAVSTTIVVRFLSLTAV